ncbi:MAG: trypsin-like peptidase domain-containing protein [Bacteroidota bacterium]
MTTLARATVLDLVGAWLPMALLSVLFLGATVPDVLAQDRRAHDVRSPDVQSPEDLDDTQAMPQAAPLLFMSASQPVVQWRSPFTVTADLLTTASTDAERAAWEDAFVALNPFDAPWEVLRVDEVETRTTEVGTYAVLELRRSFTVRLTATGPAATSEPVLSVGSRQATAPPVSVTAYALDQAIYTARQQVLPLVASNRADDVQRIGSGFLIAPDALVTAYHVVVGMNRVRATLPNGKTVTTRRVWVLDPARDIAILHVDPERMARAGVVPLPLSDAAEHRGVAPDDTQLGGITLTAGWPSGQQSITEARRYADLHIGHRLLVSANAVGPGDSGGPLLDTQGGVLGVVVSGRNTRGETDLLREDLCMATDLQPALATLAHREAPQPLRARLSMLEAAAPHAQLLRAVADLRTMRSQRARSSSPPRPHLADLLDAAAHAPSDPALLFLVGTTLEGIGDRAAAAQAYAQALEHADGFFPAAYALGHHHLRRGEFAEAAARFEHTAEHTAYQHLAALGLARTYTKRYAYRAAIGALRKALQADPTYAPALYLLAYSHLGLGDEATARMLHVRLQRLDARWAERTALHLRAEPLRPIALTDVAAAP